MKAVYRVDEDRMSSAYAFVGSVLPEALCKESVACHAAGNKFQIELLKAIQSISGLPVFVLSTFPVGVFPKSRRVVATPREVTVRDGMSGWMIPFINILFLKQITIGVANFLFLSVWLWKNRKKRRLLLVYNLYPPMSLPVLLAARLFGATSIAVVPDFPHNLSFNFRGLRGALQRLNVWLEATSLSRFTGIIPLTRYISDDFAPKHRALVMEGGVSDEEADAESAPQVKRPESPETVCLFSGTLSDVNGIALLLDAFCLIPDPTFRLWILGRGPLEHLVRKAAADDTRIVYWGFVPNAEVMRLQRQATLLLNARPTDQLIARYTFPSKLLEYMLSGRPVLSTALPGIPDEYHQFIHVLLEANPEALAAMIQRICSRPAAELDEFGKCSRAFVLGNKTWTQQGKRVFEFLETL